MTRIATKLNEAARLLREVGDDPADIELLRDRVAELEELIADFFRGLRDADELREAVS